MRERNCGKFLDFRAVAKADKPRMAVTEFIESQNQRALERRRVEGAGGVAQVMIEGFDAGVSARGHLSYEALIVEFTAEFAEGFVEEVAALDGSDGGTAGAEKRLALPGAPRIRGDGDAIDLIPGNSGAFEAEADCLARNPGSCAVSGDFAFFDSGDDAGIAKQRGCRVMTHRG